MRPLDYRWGHAVNSHELLEGVKREIHDGAAATGPPTTRATTSPLYVNAVEADVIWSAARQIAVMGHPPQVDGELSLSTFLDEMQALATRLNAHNNAAASSVSASDSPPLIVKLDFKSMQAFRASYELLRVFIAAFPFSRGVFINADILVGPANTSDISFPDADEFLRDACALGGSTHTDKIVLSVGWTTSNATEEEFRRGYSHEMITEMLHVLAPYKHMQVTFPVRATSVRSSWDALQQLLLGPRNFGFTLWWAKTQMSNDELEWLYSTLEDQASSFADRTFYDILGFESFLQRRQQHQGT